MIERDVFKILENELARKPITALVGARQTGKTTSLQYLLKQLETEAVFITFDDNEILKIFNENIGLFIEQYIKPYKYIFIDEFQYAPEGGKKLKLIFDTVWRKMFISGSSKAELAINSLGYLVGRVSIIEMQTVSFEEFVKYKSPQKALLFTKVRSSIDFQQLMPEFVEFMTYGGYPAVITENNFENKKKLLQDIIATYLLREIKDILGYKNSRVFDSVISRLAIQNGKLTNISKLSNDLNINWNLTSEIISVLIKTGIIIEVKPFFSNKAKELIKMPKLYFHDNGFVNSIIKNFGVPDERIDKGEIFESFVLHELINKNHECKYWNRQRSEVDFILEHDSKITAIEVKSKLKRMPVSLKRFLDMYQITKAMVLNENLDNNVVYETTNVQLLHLFNIVNLSKTL